MSSFNEDGDLGERDGVVVEMQGRDLHNARFLNTRNGKYLKGRKRRLEMIKRDLLKTVGMDADGNPIYMSAGGENHGYVLSSGESIGNGVFDLTAPVLGGELDARVGVGESSVSARERVGELEKRHALATEVTLNRKIEEYKEGLSELLEVVGFVQRNVLLKTADDEVVLDNDAVRKLRLGLDACDRVLDRLIGKPKSVSEVRHSDVFSELSKLDDEWVVSSEDVIVEE